MNQEGGAEVLKELLDHRRPEEKEELWRNLRLDWVRNWDLSCQMAVLLSRLSHTGKELIQNQTLLWCIPRPVGPKLMLRALTWGRVWF